MGHSEHSRDHQAGCDRRRKRYRAARSTHCGKQSLEGIKTFFRWCVGLRLLDCHGRYRLGGPALGANINSSWRTNSLRWKSCLGAPSAAMDRHVRGSSHAALLNVPLSVALLSDALLALLLLWYITPDMSSEGA